jgi:ABC-type branched-subunit amino acid transport system substrate-binding protein
MGPGVTATTIALGIPYCSDCAAANGALGADGEDPGDERRYYQAALDEVNSRGGVLGRKLVPVFHQISASDNIDVSAQAMCETFTKDHKVAAIFFRTQIIDECAKKAGIIAVSDSGSGRLFAQYPNLFSPATIRFEGLAAATVKGMVAAGWHKPTAKWPTGKIGLITWDDNEYKYAVSHGWLPALSQAGLKATDVRYVAVPQSDKSLADSSSAIASAVLSFRDQAIDHVFIADGPAGIFRGGGLTLQFLDQAKAQQYFPRYGFNTNNAPGDSALPADEQSGMLAVDANDLQASNDEGIAPNPQRLRCYALMNKKGYKTTDAKATGLLALEACEVAWFSEAIFTHSRGTTLSEVIAGGESLGTFYRSPYAFGTRLGPGRHDGLRFFRNSRFDDACACMKYTSKPYEP